MFHDILEFISSKIGTVKYSEHLTEQKTFIKAREHYVYHHSLEIKYILVYSIRYLGFIIILVLMLNLYSFIFREFAVVKSQFRYELTKTKYKYVSKAFSNSCPICINCIGSDDIVTVLKCRHMFHIECIYIWFYRNATCPLCRTTEVFK